MQTIKLLTALFICGSALLLTNSSCNKQKEVEVYSKAQPGLVYADSILYKANKDENNFAYPQSKSCGRYSSFPQGLDIDIKTGAINLSNSETGLRYRITYTSPSGTSSSSLIVLSGVNYVDAYFKMYGNDSVLIPVYNADVTRIMPAASFDVDGSARAKGCAINPTTGEINLRQSVRNGLFGPTQNWYKKEVEIKYRIHDGSKNTLQSITMLLYYYNTMNDVPADLVQKIDDHLEQVLRTTASGSMTEARATAISKPRPPCVVVIAH